MPLLLNDNYVNRRKYRNKLKEMQDFPCEFEEIVSGCNGFAIYILQMLGLGKTPLIFFNMIKNQIMNKVNT